MLFLIRHCEYDNPNNIYAFHLPVTLSARGRERAKRIGLWLKDRSEKLVVYSSPIIRAVQTAEIIASFTNSHVYIDSDLIEVKEAKLQGKKMPPSNPYKDIYKPGLQEAPELMLERMRRVFNKHIKSNNDIALVSHGDPLTILLYELLNEERPVNLTFSKHYIEKGEVVVCKKSSDKNYVIKRFQP